MFNVHSWLIKLVFLVSETEISAGILFLIFQPHSYCNLLSNKYRKFHFFFRQNILGIPASYHDLALPFIKEKSLSLPPHHTYDCAFEVLPDALLPSSRSYNLSGPEETMKRYIEEYLASCIICLSTSPLGVVFLSLLKKRTRPSGRVSITGD